MCFRRKWQYSFSDFTALNAIDASALECLETINKRLRDAVVTFHLSEDQGPAMDRLQNSDLLGHLSGQVLLTHHQAMMTLALDQADRHTGIKKPDSPAERSGFFEW